MKIWEYFIFYILCTSAISVPPSIFPNNVLNLLGNMGENNEDKHKNESFRAMIGSLSLWRNICSHLNDISKELVNGCNQKKNCLQDTTLS